MRTPSLLFATVILAACSNYEPLRPEMSARIPPSRMDEIAYINTLRSAMETVQFNGCLDGYEIRAFDQRYAQGRPGPYVETEEQYPATRPARSPRDASNPNSGTTVPPPGPCVGFQDVAVQETLRDGEIETDDRRKMRRYLHAGFGLSDIYCQRFFLVAAGAQANRSFARDSVSNVQTLVTAILGLATAGETAIGITSGVLGGVENTFTDYDGAFLVDPDMGQVRDLVHAAQWQYRSNYRTGEPLPGSYEQARAVVERYAGICTFTNMRRLIATALETSRERLLDSVEQAETGQTETGTSDTSDISGTSDTSGTSENESGTTEGDGQDVDPPAEASVPIT